MDKARLPDGQGKRFIDAYHEVLKSFGSTSGLREIQQQTLKSEDRKAKNMVKNYFTVAWRSLRRHSFYSFINITGLAVGVSACLIIVLFIIDELSFDTYNTKADRIFRVDAEIKFGGNHFKMAYRGAPEAHTMMQDYPEIDPIGKKISTFKENEDGDERLDPDRTESWTVIGVVEDFHFASMKESISALGLFLEKSDGSVSFLFKPEKTHDVIENLEKTWKQLAPGQPFQYSFLDEDFESMYRSEQRHGKIFALFAGLAIIIACMGLFALTAFTAEQRTKEIGIHKVLGASVSSIVLLLSRDFGKLILVAFFVSAPTAWYAVNWWLESYTYKTEIGVPVYLLSGALAFTIALVTMSYQSIKAAATNPVESLRTE